MTSSRSRRWPWAQRSKSGDQNCRYDGADRCAAGAVGLRHDQRPSPGRPPADQARPPSRARRCGQSAIIKSMGGGLIGGSIGAGLSDDEKPNALWRPNTGRWNIRRRPAGGLERRRAPATYGEVVAAQPYRVGSQDCRQYAQTVYTGRPAEDGARHGLPQRRRKLDAADLIARRSPANAACSANWPHAALLAARPGGDMRSACCSG